MTPSERSVVRLFSMPIVVTRVSKANLVPVQPLCLLAAAYRLW